MSDDHRTPGHGRAHAAIAWTRLVAVVGARGVVATLLGFAIWAAGPTMLGWHVTTVVSDSMRPGIAAGDVIAARPVAASELRIGQVLLSPDPDHPDRLRLHRSVEMDDGRIVTRGDANAQTDSSTIAPDDVLGVGALRVPFVGTPVVWMQQQEWAPLLGTAALVLGAVAVATRSATGRVRTVEASSVDADDADEARALADVDARSSTTEVGEHARAPRSARRGIAVTVALVVTALIAAIATPVAVAHAAFSDTSAQHATFATATATAPSQLRCVSNANGTATISWQHPGGGAGFTTIVGGRAGAALGPDSRSVTISAQSLFSWSRQTVAVRSDLGGTWSATSSAVTISVFSILGIGSVRCA